MNPETVKTLVGSEQGKELVKFIAGELLALNALDGINELESNEVIARTVCARREAAKILSSILEPFILAGEQQPNQPKNEYGM